MYSLLVNLCSLLVLYILDIGLSDSRFQRRNLFFYDFLDVYYQMQLSNATFCPCLFKNSTQNPITSISISISSISISSTLFNRASLYLNYVLHCMFYLGKAGYQRNGQGNAHVPLCCEVGQFQRIINRNESFNCQETGDVLCCQLG